MEIATIEIRPTGLLLALLTSRADRRVDRVNMVGRRLVARSEEKNIHKQLKDGGLEPRVLGGGELKRLYPASNVCGFCIGRERTGFDLHLIG